MRCRVLLGRGTKLLLGLASGAKGSGSRGSRDLHVPQPHWRITAPKPNRSGQHVTAAQPPLAQAASSTSQPAGHMQHVSLFARILLLLIVIGLFESRAARFWSPGRLRTGGVLPAKRTESTDAFAFAECTVQPSNGPRTHTSEPCSPAS